MKFIIIVSEIVVVVLWMTIFMLEIFFGISNKYPLVGSLIYILIMPMLILFIHMFITLHEKQK
jgi:hypothetical protein